MATFSLKLPPELAAKVTAAAEKAGIAKSELIRRALESYLDGQSRLGKSSFASLARDLIGSLEGPSDLSSDPKYLDDYGR